MERDEELQRTPLAELWVSELGATVPEYHQGQPPPHPVRRRRWQRLPVPPPPSKRAAPDPTRDQPPA